MVKSLEYRATLDSRRLDTNAQVANEYITFDFSQIEVMNSSKKQNSISGLQLDEPSSVICIKINIPKVKVTVNTKSILRLLQLTHLQTTGKGTMDMGMC